MIEIRRILCPTDFSDFSRRALEHAVAIARWYESTITVLHVFSTAPVAADAPGAPSHEPIVLTRADRDQMLAEMQRFIEAEPAPGIPVEAMMREGNAASEILNQAIALNVDLLVIGTHGRSGFERLLLGSVTEKVLRKAACPVLSVPPRLPDALPETPVVLKGILCPVDFSVCSTHALTYAMSLAQEADAHLTVLHVMTSELEDDTPGMSDPLISDERLSPADSRGRREESIRQRLKEVVPDTVPTYGCVETMVSHGKPGREVLRIAAAQQSDLIVMGVSGHSAVDLMFLGSTTQSVIRQATCPVLTLGPD